MPVIKLKSHMMVDSVSTVVVVIILMGGCSGISTMIPKQIIHSKVCILNSIAMPAIETH